MDISKNNNRNCLHSKLLTTDKSNNCAQEYEITCTKCLKKLYFFHSCQFDYHEPCPVTEINDKEWYETVYQKCTHENMTEKFCDRCGNKNYQTKK